MSTSAMSEGLVSALLTRLDELEDLAHRASPGPWRANAEHDEVLAVDDETVCDGFALSNRQLRATVDHIVANDPDAILRLCRAHRQIIELHQQAEPPYAWMCQTCGEVGQEQDCTYPCDTLRALAVGLGVSVEEDQK